MTESEKARLIIEISKLTLVAREVSTCGLISCVKITDVIKLISDWGVEE